MATKRAKGSVLPQGSSLRGGRYVVTGLLGRGTSSVIYSIREGSAKAPLAVKECFSAGWAIRTDYDYVEPRPGHEKQFSDSKKFLEQEGEILSLIDHPNVVRIRDSFSDKGTCYIVLEHCGNTSLEAYCAKQKGASQLDERLAIRLMAPLLEALGEVHDRGILHCDINPANIHVIGTSSGAELTPVLLDFGSARFIGTNSRNAWRPLTVCPGYSPPEQEEGRIHQLRPQSDVYSSAATLYRLVLGTRPPSASSRRNADQVHARIKEGCQDAALAEALTKGLALDHDDRPRGARAFRELLRDSPEPRTAPPSPETIAAERVRRNLWTLVPYGIMLMVMMAMLAYFLWPIGTRKRIGDGDDSIGVVRPTDFYMLRDVSHTVSTQNYDFVEGQIHGVIRFNDDVEADGDADFLSYAHFAENATSGTSRAPTLQSATRGDSLNATKRRLEGWRPPKLFRDRTSFVRVFEQLGETLASSGDRGALISLLTDGVPDPDGRRGACPEPGEEVFEEGMRESLTELMADHDLRVMIFLLGGAARCATDIGKAWDSLKEEMENTPGIAGRLEIIRLTEREHADADDARVRQSLEKTVRKALDGAGRGPSVSLRPQVGVLDDKQREEFDQGKEFTIAVVGQGHLGHLMELEVEGAELLDCGGKLASRLAVTGKRSVSVDSQGGARNGPVADFLLTLAFTNGFKPQHGKDYQVRFLAQGYSYTDAERRAKVKVDIQTEKVAVLTSERAHKRMVRERKISMLALIVLAVAALFSLAIVRFTRMRDGRAKRLIRRYIIRELRTWAIAFSFLGVLLSFLAFFAVGPEPASYVLPSLLLAAMISLAIVSIRVMKGEEDYDLGHRVLACVDAFLAPTVALLARLASSFSF